MTGIYVLANVAYLGVLTPTEMLSSEAIAVVRPPFITFFYFILFSVWPITSIVLLQTLGDKMLGMMNWLMPVCVAMSAFGGLSVHIMTSSRYWESTFPCNLWTNITQSFLVFFFSGCASWGLGKAIYQTCWLLLTLTNLPLHHLLSFS